MSSICFTQWTAQKYSRTTKYPDRALSFSQVPDTLYLDNSDLVGAAYLGALHKYGLKNVKLDFFHFLGRLKKLLYETHSLTGVTNKSLSDRSIIYKLQRQSGCLAV
jgi:hypothetical protein